MGGWVGRHAHFATKQNEDFRNMKNHRCPILLFVESDDEPVMINLKTIVIIIIVSTLQEKE